MMRIPRLHILVALMAVSVLSSCSDDDHYHFPSVREEFFTAQTDGTGALRRMLTDAAVAYDVVQDDAEIRAAADTTLRLVGYYEADEQQHTAHIYAASKAVAPLPVPAGELQGDVETDPVDVVSVWKGFRYLNMVIAIRNTGGKHRVVFVEEDLTPPDATTGQSTLTLSLLHQDGDDPQSYTSRVYASVPLAGYFTAGVQVLNVSLRVLTYSGEWKTYNFQY